MLKLYLFLCSFKDQILKKFPFLYFVVMFPQSTPAICGPRTARDACLLLCRVVRYTRCGVVCVLSSAPFLGEKLNLRPREDCTGTLITEFLLFEREDFLCGADSVMSFGADLWW